MASNTEVDLPPKRDGELRATFTNPAPEDEEWTAHIKILNEWTDPDRYLREIIQYARSGPFYPADMHVDLIRQVIEQECSARERAAEQRGRLHILERIEDTDGGLFALDPHYGKPDDGERLSILGESAWHWIDDEKRLAHLKSDNGGERCLA